MYTPTVNSRILIPVFQISIMLIVLAFQAVTDLFFSSDAPRLELTDPLSSYA